MWITMHGTLLTTNCKGDSRYTFDAGYETMVFPCDENGNVTSWGDLYVEHYITQEQMNVRHKEIAENLSVYID